MSVTPEQIEAWSEPVHIGWMQEKQRQGFVDHPFKTDSLAQTGGFGRFCVAQRCGQTEEKHYADMLPYADLAENVKEYDRATVRAVVKAQEDTGYAIVRADELQRLTDFARAAGYAPATDTNRAAERS